MGRTPGVKNKPKEDVEVTPHLDGETVPLPAAPKEQFDPSLPESKQRHLR